MFLLSKKNWIHLRSISSWSSRKTSRTLQTLGTGSSSLSRETTLSLNGDRMTFSSRPDSGLLKLVRCNRVWGLTLGPVVPEAPASPGTPWKVHMKSNTWGEITAAAGVTRSCSLTFIAIWLFTGLSWKYHTLLDDSTSSIFYWQWCRNDPENVVAGSCLSNKKSKLTWSPGLPPSPGGPGGPGRPWQQERTCEKITYIIHTVY